MNAYAPTQARRQPIARPALALIAVGGAALAIGGILSPPRLWANLLLMTFLLVGLGLAGLLFMSFHHLTGARWSEPLLRIPAALAKTLPYTTILLGGVIVVGLRNYPWMHEDLAHHPPFWFKAAWLSPTFFLARTAIYLLVWVGLAGALLRAARRHDSQNSLATRRSNVRLSALFLVLYGLTFSLATTDWTMSLEPEWYSTVFAVYHFAGAFAAGLAIITLLTIALRRSGALRSAIGPAQLHDLGKLLFGFSCFWMYIWFSQYMLIWYANISEETIYFVRRTQGAWGPVFVLNLALNWAIPFLALLPRAAKRSESMLAKVALVMLAGHWLDMYLAVLPPLAGAAPVFGFAEIGTLLVGVGGFGLLLDGTVRTSVALDPESRPDAGAELVRRHGVSREATNRGLAVPQESNALAERSLHQ